MADHQQKKNPEGKRAKNRDEGGVDDIFEAPVFMREPSSRQVKLGSKVVLRVVATGRPLPSFQWFHNGKKISGAISDFLTLTKVRRLAAGGYHCEAKNFQGKAVSRVCMLSFFTQKIPQLVIGPQKSSVEEGKPFVLKVTSPDANALKGLDVYWTLNGMRIKGARGLELTFGAVKKKYEGEYKAMISVASVLETSNVAMLFVRAAGQTASAPVCDELIEEELDKTRVEMQQAPESAKSAPAESNSRWEDLTFDPEAEEGGEGDFVGEVSAPAPERESELFAEAVPEPVPVIQINKKNRAQPKLARRKKFLEKFLNRWQKHCGQSAAPRSQKKAA